MSSANSTGKALDSNPGSSNQKVGNFGASSRAGAQAGNPLAFMNMFNMAHFLQMAQGRPSEDANVPTTSAAQQFNGGFSGLPMGFGSNGNFDLAALFKGASNGTSEGSQRKSSSSAASPASKPSESPSTEARGVAAVRLGTDLRKALEAEDMRVVRQMIDAFDSKKLKIDRLPAETIRNIVAVSCSTCHGNFSDIWALRSHCEEVHNSDLPTQAAKSFAERLDKVISATTSEMGSANGVSDSRAPEAKRPKLEPAAPFTTDSGRSSAASTPKLPMGTPKKSDATTMEMSNPLAMMSMMSAAGFPFMANPFMSMMSPDMMQTAAAMSGFAAGVNPLLASMPSVNSTPQKRARTRITDDQLKILRQYFDINNSPTEQQIKEMSVKAQLPEKVIKHWFRNTLFKERQRDKDSPYNFNVPPQLSIDLDTYEKTGEARVLPVKAEAERSSPLNPNASSEPVSTSNASSTPSSPINTSLPGKIEPAEEGQSPAKQGTIESALNAAANNAIMNSIKQAAAAAGIDFANPAAPQNPFASLLNGMPMDDKMFGSMLSGLGSPPILPPAGFLGPHSSASSATSTMTTGTTSMGSGRRANRTRFTDFQLRTLQNFFDKQAYPKDDDLEMLSKKLSLSPRVIVVWFQNARQKARKIYENQPNQDNNDRFVKTPGCNFQCKRCQLVFQRYYELIQHQQKLCYAGDCDAQQTDNKSVEENLTEEEKSGNHPAEQSVSAMDQLNSIANASATPSETSNTAAAGVTAFVSENNNAEDLLKLITGGNPSSAEEVLKMFKTKEKSAFYKRCPFCGLLFHAKEKMLEHFAERHAEQYAASPVDPDSLPEAEDVPNISSTDDFLSKFNSFATASGSPLDLSVPSSQVDNDNDQIGENSMASPSFTNSDQEDGDSQGNFPSAFDFRALSTSPAMSTSSFGAGLASNTLSAALASVSSASAAAARQQQRSPAAGGSGASKRYRTHLTPVQVYVMKSLFNVYKTPSMSECESLGAEIGLHKRVVQVWFQNARAKERKSRGSATADEDVVGAAPTHCDLCSVEFNGRTSLQDHIFTSHHIARVKDRGSLLKGGSSSSTSGTTPTLSTPVSAPTQVEDSENRRQRAKAVRDTVKKTALTGSLSSAKQTAPGADGSAGGMPLDQLPYNLMYGLQGGALPMIYDPNLMGTPIVLLQIPEAVMKQISSDMANGLSSTTFTQDGLEFQQLAGKLPAEDYKCASVAQSEVGWACPQCYNVFQQEAFLRNHQKLICAGCDGMFRLIQVHYECRPCNVKFGTQEELKCHCDALLHKANRSVADANGTSIAQHAAVTSSST